MHLRQLLLVRSYFGFHWDIMMHDTGVKGFEFIIRLCKDIFELPTQLDKISPLFIRTINPKVDETRVLLSAQVDKFIVER